MLCCSLRVSVLLLLSHGWVRFCFGAVILSDDDWGHCRQLLRSLFSVVSMWTGTATMTTPLNDDRGKDGSNDDDGGDGDLGW